MTTASSTSINILVPRPTPTPRGAVAVGLIANFVVDTLAWNKARVERRARVRDAMALRAYANSFRSSEPSLASELMAAADRAI